MSPTGMDDVDRAIVELLVEGATNREIARALDIPEGTVKWRIHRLYQRFRVSSRVQFVRRLSEQGW